MIGLARRLEVLQSRVQYWWDRTHPARSFFHPPQSEATSLVWSLGWALACDVHPFPLGIPSSYSTCPHLPCIDPRAYVHHLKDGVTVWVASGQLDNFVRYCLPRIRAQFTLVISDGDDTFPMEVGRRMGTSRWLDDPRIIAVFAQNLDNQDRRPNWHPLPIGIDFHSMNRPGGAFGCPSKTPGEQESEILELAQEAPPVEQRERMVFADFQCSDRLIYDGSRRSDIFRELQTTGTLQSIPALVPRSELWRQKTRVAFSASPHGNGLDCHRTWEDLVLGCIVIVKSSPLDPLYEGLPVAIVRSWNEVSPEKLELWIRTLGPRTRDPAARERLTARYWNAQIRKATDLGMEER